MSELSREHDARRIVVGLRSASNAERAIAAATVLASVIEARIVGLFVQEEIMLDLAEFPFARVLDFDKPQPRKVSRQSMNEAFVRTAAICRRTLSNHAGKARVGWSFSTRQGEFKATVEAEAGSGDYVVLSSETHGTGIRALIDALRMMPANVAGVVVAGIDGARRSSGPVVAIDDGDATGARTVALAARLAAVEGKSLHLFAVAAADADAQRIQARAATLIGKGQTMVRHRYAPGSPQSIAAGIAHLSPFFVVGDLDGEPFRDDSVAIAVLRAAKAPVLLLRKI
jgi:hypothetical protein